MQLKNLEPSKVFYYFEEITKIPHGSGNEKELSDYIVKFAKERNLEVYQDDVYNIIIKKPASKGYENAPTVILQGHLDMVCEKNTDVDHDFDKEALKLKVNGDMIEAEGTTLGGDDGIAVAYAMAILDDDTIKHPPIEVVFTIEEETGMRGAFNLNKNLLAGKYLINLDSEKEGQLLVSCAGGAKVKVKIPIETEKPVNNMEYYLLHLKGLKGGHSGEDINKNRANANILMGRMLLDIFKQNNIKLISVNGGAKDNAIPREMFAEFAVSDNDNDFKEFINKWNMIVDNELGISDPNIKFEIKPKQSTTDSIFTKESTEIIIQVLNSVPNGVQSMSSDIDGLVQSSLNLGIVRTENNQVILTFALRSSKESLLDNMLNKLTILAKIYNGEFIKTSQYPAWEYNKNSKLQRLFIDVYKEMFNKLPEIKAIHAGLECGIFAKEKPELDMISLGPDMEDIHTPDEKLSISSTKRTWDYVLDVLSRIKG